MVHCLIVEIMYLKILTSKNPESIHCNLSKFVVLKSLEQVRTVYHSVLQQKTRPFEQILELLLKYLIHETSITI